MLHVCNNAAAAHVRSGTRSAHVLCIRMLQAAVIHLTLGCILFVIWRSEKQLRAAELIGVGIKAAAAAAAVSFVGFAVF